MKHLFPFVVALLLAGPAGAQVSTDIVPNGLQIYVPFETPEIFDAMSVPQEFPTNDNSFPVDVLDYFFDPGQPQQQSLISTSSTPYPYPNGLQAPLFFSNSVVYVLDTHPNFEEIYNTPDFTYTMFIRCDDWDVDGSVGYRRVFALGDGNFNETGIYAVNGGLETVYTHDLNATNNRITLQKTENPTLQSGQWYFVAMRRQGATVQTLMDTALGTSADMVVIHQQIGAAGSLGNTFKGFELYTFGASNNPSSPGSPQRAFSSGINLNYFGIADFRYYNRALNNTELDSIYQRIATVVDTSGNDTTDTTTARIRLDLPDLVLYPNPAQHTLQLRGDFAQGGLATLRDLAGREVQTFSLSGQAATLPVGDLPRGLYLLNVQTPLGRAARRVVLH